MNSFLIQSHDSEPANNKSDFQGMSDLEDIATFHTLHLTTMESDLRKGGKKTRYISSVINEQKDKFIL